MSLLRALLGGLGFLIAAALISWLVYSNDELTTLRLVGLWNGQGLPNPLTAANEDQVQLPLGLWFFIFAMLGVFVGLFLGWFVGGQTRVRARQQGRRARLAERTLARFRKESDEAKIEADDLKIANKDLAEQVKRAEDKALPAPEGKA